MSREFTTYKKVDKEDEESVGSRKPKLIRYDNDDPIYGYSKTLRQGSGRASRLRSPGPCPCRLQRASSSWKRRSFGTGSSRGRLLFFAFGGHVIEHGRIVLIAVPRVPAISYTWRYACCRRI